MEIEDQKRHRRYRSRGLAAVCLFFVVSLFAKPLVASAQMTVIIAGNTYELTQQVVKETVDKPFQVAFMTILWNFFTFISNRISYDAAVAIATAGNGQQPLIELRDPKAYLISLGEDVAGAGIDALSETLEAVNIHFNLCAPTAPAFRLMFQLGVKSAYERPKPSCDFQSFVSNWQGFVADSLTAKNPDQTLLANFAQAMNPRTTDLTAGIQLYSQIIQDGNLNKSVNFSKFLAGTGFKDVTDIITGQVKTPATIVGEAWRDSDPWGDPNSHKAIFHEIMGSKELWRQLGLSALGTFTNTLLSKLTDRVYSGFFTTQVDQSSPFDVASIGFNGGVAAAEAHFNTFYTTTPISLDTYNEVSEFTTCPGTTTRQLNNCVMDPNFGTAVASADAGNPLTLKNAIDDGFVNGDWPLISATDSRNTDQNCYTYGFCYANLVRMRIARVIPVGWEMAAALQTTSTSDTLQTVVDAFDNTASPYYHLIDPNWVLKYPSTQCRASVPGQLVSDTGSTRGTECADAPSCIQEDASGTCIGGYGYCALEKNSWNFRGDSCPEQFATCLSFDNGSGTTENWLLNTTDAGKCNADNAGCLWYSTTKTDAVTAGTFDWPVIDNVPADDAVATAYQNRMYVNNNASECTSADAGCSRLIEKTADVAVNLIQNPSFETDVDVNSVPDHWVMTGGSSHDVTSGNAEFGSKLVTTGNTGTVGTISQTDLPIQNSTFYTLSFYAAQQNSAAARSVRVDVILDSEDGSESVDLTGTSYSSLDCAPVDLDHDPAAKKEAMQMTVTPSSTGYQRYTCTFTSPTFTAVGLGSRIQSLTFGSLGVLIDGVQLEEGETVSDYREGYGKAVADMSPVYYKLPPAYLGCTGADTDAADCANFSTMCTAQDNGCDLYSPVNGDPSVPGITSDLDACPAECAGYATYKQEPTNYEPNGAFPVYFIPASAVSCSEQYVGCDEFTNLADESTSDYIYLRACETPDQTINEANYYTWEGSDLSGFQLKSWTLLKSDLASTAAINYSESTGVDDTSAGEAPCSRWSTTSSAIICHDAANADRTNHLADLEADDNCNEHSDIFNTPDCREFYDASGNIHYRRFSETVTVTDSCNNYRKTDVVGADTAEKTSNCGNAGGYWDTTTGECRFYGNPDESTSCPATMNGCREYTGGASANSTVVFQDDFESAALTSYVISSATASVSSESVATDGHSIHVTASTNNSYAAVGIGDVGTSTCAEADGCTVDASGNCSETDGCDVTVGTAGFACTVTNGAKNCGPLVGQLASGKTYILSFWAKGATNGVAVTPEFIDNQGSTSTGTDAFSAVSLTTNWQQYTVGPLDTAADTNFGDTAILAFSVPAVSSGNEFFVDNITLRQVEEKITVIKDSWVTPATCDETADGAAAPLYQLGCQQYTNSSGVNSYLKSFTRLCSENKVGCKEFMNTEASDSPYAATYNMTCEYGESHGAEYDPATAVAHPWTGNFDCTIGGVTYCTILAGDSSCQFNLDTAIPRNADGTLPFEALEEGFGYTMKLGPDARAVAPDFATYFVANSSFACDSSVMGCMEVGTPTFGADQTQVASWESTYLLDQPDTYSTTLCHADSLFCDAWDTTKNGTYYFKNPETKTCEYKTGVSINGTAYSGWFRSGTSQFCYGTGACSLDSTRACSTDADCAATSTLSDTGTCAINTGTYLIGGTASGIWRNGDTAYDNWTGACDAQYDLCSEFNDPSDVQAGETYDAGSGQSYFFLNNDSIDESVLPAAQRCDSQVSQKQGCALFDNTVNAELTYNASASYLLSVHASDFYSGDTSYALVDPVSCPDGGSVTNTSSVTYDLCTSRCAYLSASLHPYDTFGTDDYTYSTSCLSDTDCPDLTSDGGDLISGTCEFSSFTGSDGTTAITVPSLVNDTNMIQKVNLDRACSQWFAPSSVTKVWDSSTNAFKNVSDGIGLCDQYSSLSETTACSHFVLDQTPTVLTDSRYAARDVSWYGREYSGFSIPNQVLATNLSQFNVSPSKWCVDPNGVVVDGVVTGSTLPFVDCGSSDSICTDVSDFYTCATSTDDFRLVLSAGFCEQETGDSCTIGFCASTGAACNSDTDCDSGDTCDTGYCLVVPNTTSTNIYQTCTSSADCTSSTYNTCVDSVCSESTNTPCNLAAECGSSATGTSMSCQRAAVTETGTCVNSSCLLQPTDSDGNGEPDIFSYNTAEDLVCRGWPESASPFPNSVVSTWVNAADAGSATTVDDAGFDARPYQTLSTFDKVTLCAAGQNCDCSYEKVTYGSATKYLDENSTSLPSYVCVGGTYDGAGCSASGGTDTTTTPNIVDVSTTTCEDTGGGKCTLKSTQQTEIGMQGFCLQRDTAININGDQNQHACLIWLPIDRPAGASDIYGKNTEAGYPLADTFYCAEPQMYADLEPSFADIANGLSACAEQGTNGSGNCTVDTEYSGCVDNVECPAHFYAIMGRCSIEDADAETGVDLGTLTAGCYEPFLAASRPNRRFTDGDNDCPFVCVPDNSYKYDSTADSWTACSDPDVLDNTSDVASFTADYETGSNSTPVWEIRADDATQFDAVVEYYQGCKTRGIANDAQLKSDFVSSGGASYRDLYFPGEIYPGCRTLVQVASTAENVAWTNRVLYTDSSYRFTIDDGASSAVSKFFYTINTGASPFGIANDPVTQNNFGDAYPVTAASCVEQRSFDSYEFDPTTIGVMEANPTLSRDFSLPTGSSFDVCPEFQVAPPHMLGTNTTPESRSFINMDLSAGTGYVADDFDYNGETLANAFTRLGEIFAKVDLSVWQWDDTTQWDADPQSQYVLSPTDLTTYDSTYDTVKSDSGDSLVDGTPTAPVIRSIGSVCVDQYCREGSDNHFSINGHDNTVQTGTNGQFLADTKFFVEANPNQMPIRRVIVDWQDSTNGTQDLTGSLADNNYYKNRRGLSPTDNQICGSNAMNFGETTPACDSNYFNVQHYFTCSESEIRSGALPTCSESATTGELSASPCTGGSLGSTTFGDVCVFQPRIQVRDNWGWCNGRCPGGTDTANGGLGCYDDDGSISTSGNGDECNLEYPDSHHGTTDPWTYYDGVIEVQP